MAKSRFTGDVDLWTEGDKVRVVLSGSSLATPVRLSIHRSTDGGEALLRDIAITQLSTLQLKGDATLAVKDETHYTVHTPRHSHVATLSLVEDQVLIEARNLSSAQRTRRFPESITALTENAAYQRHIVPGLER